MKKLLLLVGLLLVASVAFAAEAPKAKLFAPSFTLGAGVYSPADLGYIRAWKGVDAKNYLWGEIGNPAWGNLGVVLRVEQQVQRLPDGRRPNTTARMEVGWKF
jgi:hypothetical protein